MSNHYVQKIASVILILGIFVSIFMAAQTARAQAPFGGTIVQFVPPIPFVCAFPHVLIIDFAKNTAIGVAPVGGSLIFAYYNLFTPGTFVLGSHALTPLVCLLPYPIFPIEMIGTSQ